MIRMVNHPGGQPQHLFLEELEQMELVRRVASWWWFVVRVERDHLHVGESGWPKYQVNIFLLIGIYLLIFLLYLEFKHFSIKFIRTEK